MSHRVAALAIAASLLLPTGVFAAEAESPPAKEQAVEKDSGDAQTAKAAKGEAKCQQVTGSRIKPRKARDCETRVRIDSADTAVKPTMIDRSMPSSGL